MKRAILPLLTLVSLLIPMAAHAEWVTEEIKWRKSSVGSPTSATASYVRDTLYNVIAAGQTDTTGGFTLDKASFWREGHSGAATTVDTVTVAYLVIQSDSSGVANSTISNITVKIDGAVGGMAGNTPFVNFTQVDSLKTFHIPGRDRVIAIPLRAIGGLGYPDEDATTGANFFYKIMAYPSLRARITPGAGLISACRVFIRYWKERE